MTMHNTNVALTLILGIRVMAVDWVGIRVRILFCSSITQVYALCRCRMGMALRLGLGSVVRFRVNVRISLSV